ncbi:hypothetical protein D1007_49785 [Hordeum vulgare]|nr:hypothetical protein D1007_49785 [Hordeum vulgare]
MLALQTLAPPSSHDPPKAATRTRKKLNSNEEDSNSVPDEDTSQKQSQRKERATARKILESIAAKRGLSLSSEQPSGTGRTKVLAKKSGQKRQRTEFIKAVVHPSTLEYANDEEEEEMEYEAGLVVSGPMTQLEAEIWIQNMENHFGSNLISRKYEVEHALRYFTQSAAIWWKMHHAIQGFSGAETWDEFKKTLLRSRLIRKCYDNPKENICACKICGEIGHTQEEHKDGCTHCEENHPAEECPSSQVTCFLCEGTTHYPAQCHIYPKVQQVVKQQKDTVKETLKKKILEEPVMIENIEDPDEQGLTRFFSNACYSCAGEGHYSQDCTKRSQEYLGNFPTEKVEFYPLEIEELAKIKESGKKKKYPRKGQISADIDLSHVRCYKCMEFGHHKYMCL